MAWRAARLALVAAVLTGCAARPVATHGTVASASAAAPTVTESPLVRTVIVPEGAPTVLRTRCSEKGDAAACLKLGRVVLHATSRLPYVKMDSTLWFERGCERGLSEACTRKALLSTDPAYQVDLWLAACEADIAEACEGVGWAEITGATPASDRAAGEAHMRRAARLYEQACEAGSGLDCARLAVLVDDGLGVVRDPARATALAERACVAGDPVGCERVAASSPSLQATDAACGAERASCSPVGLRSELGRGLPLDPARSAALYRRGCDAGEMRACANLAFAYENGVGVERDVGEAETYYRFACDHDELIGCYGIGRMHYLGTAAEPDLRLAAGYLGDACEATGALGCRELFALTAQGVRIRRPLVDKAVDAIRARCQADDALACMELADLTTASQLVPFDGRGALAAWQRACALGHAPGCLAAGKALVDGDLVPQDKTEARTWLARGCASGDDACCRLERLHFGPLGKRAP